MTDEKVDFWKTPEGKIMSYGIHEHNSGLGHIINNLRYIELLIEKRHIEIKFNDEKYMKDFNDSLVKIRQGKEKSKDAMDYVYTKIKELTNDR
jgi:uncharacterized coiled-coil protein SlyX